HGPARGPEHDARLVAQPGGAGDGELLPDLARYRDRGLDRRRQDAGAAVRLRPGRSTHARRVLLSHPPHPATGASRGGETGKLSRRAPAWDRMTAPGRGRAAPG